MIFGITSDRKEDEKMYYDLKFPYRISAEAGIATNDEDGSNSEAYIQITIGGYKESITDEHYDKMHEEQRESVAGMLKTDVEWITPITGEEYEANVDEEED